MLYILLFTHRMIALIKHTDKQICWIFPLDICMAQNEGHTYIGILNIPNLNIEMLLNFVNSNKGNEQKII